MDDDSIAHRVAQEMQGRPLPPLSEEEIAARTAWREEIRARDERELEAWAEEAARQEQERLEAEAEAGRIQAQRQAQQREASERLAQRNREREIQRAAERAALQAQQTHARLARLESQTIQRQRHEAQWATVGRLSQLLDPPPPPPEPTVIVVSPDEGSPHFGDPNFSIEAVNRRWKFPWQD